MDVVMNGGWQLFLENATTDVLHRIANEVKDDAKAACPVLTGKLQASIDNEVIGDTARVGSNVEYAGYVEEGTRRMAAQPYLRPALYRVRSG
jgi:HK97 gp10 family phage protein